MQAILISSKDFEKGREEAQKKFNELKIDKFDITLFEYEKAVGIGNVREIQKKIYLKPFRNEIKGVLIDATNGITIEAQNALLKTLEETPEDTIIILQVLNSEEVLPTILSRCKVIELKQEKKESNNKNVLGDKIGDRLKIAQDLKDKNESLDYLENLIIDLRKDLITNYKKIKTVQKFHTIIKTTNINLRLALENLFLNI